MCMPLSQNRCALLRDMHQVGFLRGCALPLEFPLKFLKLFQDACRFPTGAGDAYHAGGNTEHIWQTRWEAL
ncbi:hypothetical protein MESS4_590027 [Mesorhizobium sp. STM 4661]|nr:hypothetical protein MESS4_590027 [Mesorhizobium sp. STM 4661]